MKEITMTAAFAALLQHPVVRVIDACTGLAQDEYNGEDFRELEILADDWAGHTVRAVSAGTEFRNGSVVEILQVWIDGAI